MMERCLMETLEINSGRVVWMENKGHTSMFMMGHLV